MQLHPIPKFNIQYRHQVLDLSTPHIMGILNVTPDSFSDGGKHNTLDNALRHAEQMIKDGATIIDIGGESTRPNATPVSESEELERVVKVVEKLRQNSDKHIWLSVDTSSPTVMQACSEVGAGIWNDVRGLSREGAVEMACQLNIPIMLMHMRGEPTTMNQLDNYDNVVEDVLNELEQRLTAITQAGVPRHNIIIDPGFGFAKNFEQNMTLLNQFYRLHEFERPVMVAISRKRSMGDVLRQAGLPHEVHERDNVSMVAGLLAVQQGACIVRTHDVAKTKTALAMWQHIHNV
ncbi:MULTISPECIES: dihydropteroate synthase [unclassified Moraxella]|uniref:dihydropteroate synthase n=1 Tax=unclassified Moraxella TaxID=2685852 RepID=UPI003AF6C5F1